MKIIHLSEVLDEMKKPKPFSLAFVTCDLERKTGGEIVRLENCVLYRKNQNFSGLGFSEPEPPVTDFSKNPDHYGNATRNIVLPNGHVKKVHIRLLLEFNGQKVFY